MIICSNFNSCTFDIKTAHISIRKYSKQSRTICIIFFSVVLMSMVLCGRLVYLMLFEGKYYETQAKDLQQRERKIKAARGKILDRNGVVLADNKSVCTISVIHNQIKEPEAVIAMLVKELGIPEEKVRKRVEKYSSLEKIKSNVDKETGNRILAYGYAGVKVDEDYITRNLVANEGDIMKGFGQDITYKQLTLFDDFSLG